MDLLQAYQSFSASVELAAGDSSKTLVAAVTGKQIVVTTLVAQIFTAAAQLVTIAAGSTTVAKIASNQAVGTYEIVPGLRKGIAGQAGSALVATPAAAGPAISFIVEGYYLPS